MNKIKRNKRARAKALQGDKRVVEGMKRRSLKEQEWTEVAWYKNRERLPHRFPEENYARIMEGAYGE